MFMFVGRNAFVKKLSAAYENEKSSLTVVYGRRRIGKSELIKHFGKNKNLFYFEGLEGGSTRAQIQLFHKKMMQFFPKENLSLYQFKTWDDVFQIFTELVKKDKTKMVIVFDEFQWMAAKQSKLVSMIKIFWDQHWKSMNLMMILCGSVAHYMALKVIKSKALYGRIDTVIQLPPLTIKEGFLFFKRVHKQEALKYFLIFGTIPKYLELIDLKKSFEENMINLFFIEKSYFLEEIEKIFFSQFKEVKNYQLIIKKLIQNNLSQEEISKVLKMKSGGGVKNYISNLENAHFISAIHNLAQETKRGLKYSVSDEYLKFYFKFIELNVSQIQKGYGKAIFNEKIKNTWLPWIGYSFESFCVKSHKEISEHLAFYDKVIDQGKFFTKEKEKGTNVQFDLVYDLSHQRCVVFEIKYNQQVDKKIIFETENKIEKIKDHSFFRNKTIETGLIYIGQLDPHIQKSGYFNYLLNFEELM